MRVNQTLGPLQLLFLEPILLVMLNLTTQDLSALGAIIPTKQSSITTITSRSFTKAGHHSSMWEVNLAGTNGTEWIRVPTQTTKS